MRAERGDDGGDASGEVGALPSEPRLGGGVGCESGDAGLKNESVRDPADLGGAADDRRGVVSLSSSARSRVDGCDELEATDEERVSGGGGTSSDELGSEKGVAKNAFVFLPLEKEGDGDGA